MNHLIFLQEIQMNNETRLINGVNETVPSFGPTELRFKSSYIRGYIMWTRLFSTGLIPVIMLLFLNIRIINDVLSASKKVQR